MNRSTGGSSVASGFTNASGVYSFAGLPTGSYLIRTSNSAGFIDELYDDIPCPLAACTVTTGTPVPAAAGGTATVNFALARGVTITGKITNASSSSPVASVRVYAYGSTGSSVTNLLTNACGIYNISGLVPGTYFARTSNTIRLIDELYDNIPCPGGACTVTTGTPIAGLGGGTAIASFALTPRAVCSLSINPTSATPGSTGGSSTVAVTANESDCAWTAVSNASWITNVTPGGTGSGTAHYTVAANPQQVSRIGTVTIAGKTFTVTQAAADTAPNAPTGLNGSVTGSTLTLSWTAPSGPLPATPLPANPAASYIIEAGSAPGLSNLATVDTGNPSTSFVANGVGTGQYDLRVRAKNAFGASGPSNEVRLVVGNVAPGAPSGLSGGASGSTLSLSWIAPTTGGAPTAFMIEAGSATGLSDIASFSTGSAATSFGAGGVPNGRYFLRVRGTNAGGTGPASNEVVVIVGPAAPGAPSGLTWSSAGSTISLWWTAPTTGGAPAAYTIEAGTNSGLANLASFSTGNAATSYSAGAIGNGTGTSSASRPPIREGPAGHPMKSRSSSAAPRRPAHRVHCTPTSTAVARCSSGGPRPTSREPATDRRPTSSKRGPRRGSRISPWSISAGPARP